IDKVKKTINDGIDIELHNYVTKNFLEEQFNTIIGNIPEEYSNIIEYIDSKVLDFIVIPEIGENENWWVDGVDTGHPSRGKDGIGMNNKGTLPLYSDLLSITNPQLNDFYYVKEDRQIYIFDGVSFPSQGDGVE